MNEAQEVEFAFKESDWQRLDEKAIKLAKRLAPVYRLLRWKWAGDQRPPAAKWILRNIRDAIEVLRSRPAVIKTEGGGIFARREVDELGTSIIVIGMSIDESISNYDSQFKA